MEELQSELSAARSRNKDVLARIELLKQQVIRLEQSLEKSNAIITSLKTKAKKHKHCQDVVAQRDALSNDVLVLVAENEKLHLHLADYEGRIAALRDIVKSMEAQRDIAHNNNVLLRSALLGQEVLKRDCEELKNEYNMVQKQNSQLKELNKMLLLKEKKKK